MSRDTDLQAARNATESGDLDVDRRSILKALGAGSLVFTGSQPVASRPGRDTVEIETTKRGRADGPDEVLRTKEVPRAWYEHQRHVRKVKEQVGERFVDDDGVRSVGITAHGDRIGEYQRQAVKIDLVGNSISRSIPERANGVPVIVEPNAPPPRRQGHDSCTNANEYDGYYSPVKGGVIVEQSSDALYDCSGFGTLCCRVEYGGAGNYFLGASHVWGCTSDDHSGADVYQHGGKIGTIKNDWKSHDAVLIEPDGSRSFSNDVVDSSDPIYGYETENEISSMVSSNASVQKRGINSGAGTATLREYKETINSCGYTVYDCIRYDTWDKGNGDSGGPYFVNDGYYNSLVGMHSWGTEFGQETKGAAAYALRAAHLVYPS